MKVDEFLSDEVKIQDLRLEDFSFTGKVHNWRNYVPYEFISDWKDLTDRERAIIFYMANQQAKMEDWE